MNTNEKYQVLFAPHPPIILPEIGNGQENKSLNTLKGMDKIAELVAAFAPETIVFITPHGNSFSNGTCIANEKEIQGDFGQFGNKGIQFKKEIDLALVKEIGEELDEMDIVNVLMTRQLAKQYKVSLELDHGVMVPMYYIDQKYPTYQIVHIAPGMTSLLEQYEIGMAIRKAIKKSGKNALIVASGDMSHCLKEEGPYHYEPMGPVFDEIMVEGIKNFDVMSLITMAPKIFEPAGQCGLRSFCMAIGSLDGYEGQGEVFSYEGPFGVGYLTGCITQGKETKSLLEEFRNNIKKNNEIRINSEDDYIKLARKTIEMYVRTNRRLDLVDIKEQLDAEFLEIAGKTQAGVFVSIHKEGNLRGCIGTILPTKQNIIDEIIDNAIQASSADPRFDSVEEKELEELEIKVDVLSEIEPISSKDELDTKRYGVVVEQGSKRGLLLPNLEGIDSVEEQIDIAKKKAGIKNDLNLKLYRFEVIRHEV